MSTVRAMAVIPARGGSKGIPLKNIAPLAGKPLVAWSIEAAQQARTIDRVVVSTDHDAIAFTSERYGAQVVRRPVAISGDLSSSESALLHVLDTVRDQDGYEPDVLVFLQCTAPLTTSGDIDGTVQALLDQQADSALAVTDFHYFLWRNEADGSAIGINHDKSVRQMRQEREPQYLETGAIYVMRVAGFREHGHRFFGKTVSFPTPSSHRLEIGEPSDLAVAEALLRARARLSVENVLPVPVEAVIFDFDGVFTDNRVWVDQDGKETVACNRGDGMGIVLLKARNVPILVISKERNPVVMARCNKLGLECLHGIDDKISLLRQWAGERGISMEKMVYVGNDVNDLECMQAVGCGLAVADAHPEALAAARHVLSANGGHGAIREVTDAIVRRIDAKT